MKKAVKLLFFNFLFMIKLVSPMEETKFTKLADNRIQKIKSLHDKILNAMKQRNLQFLNDILKKKISKELLFFSIIYKDEFHRNLIFKAIATGNFSIFKKILHLLYQCSPYPLESQDSALYVCQFLCQSDVYGNTPLTIACHGGFLDIAKTLIEIFRLEVDWQNYLGNTYLMYSVLCNRPEIVSLLLNCGANVQLKNNLNQTAYDIAVQLHRTEILSIFKQHTTSSSNINSRSNFETEFTNKLVSQMSSNKPFW